MDYDHIFWDNDGVLVDTEGLYFEASRDVLAGIGFELTPSRFVEISLATGRSVFELATSDVTLMDELRVRRNRRYSELLTERNLLLPGVRETLESLSPLIQMAIVTSSRRDHFDLIHTGTALRPLFSFILCREDYREAKPHPEPYLTALQLSGCPPSRCLVIEDSLRGLVAAKAAGLTCWVVPSAQTIGQDFSAADRVLTGVADVARLLLAGDE